MGDIYQSTHGVQPMGHSGYSSYPRDASCYIEAGRAYYGYQGSNPSAYARGSVARYPSEGAPVGRQPRYGANGGGPPGGSLSIGGGGFSSG